MKIQIRSGNKFLSALLHLCFNFENKGEAGGLNHPLLYSVGQNTVLIWKFNLKKSDTDIYLIL